MRYLVIFLTISTLFSSCAVQKTKKILKIGNLPTIEDTIFVFFPILKYSKYEVKQKGIFSNEERYIYEDNELEKFIPASYSKWIENTFVNFKKGNDTTELFKVRNYIDSLSAHNMSNNKLVLNTDKTNFKLLAMFNIRERREPIRGSWLYNIGDYIQKLDVTITLLLVDTEGRIVYHNKSSRYYDRVLYLKYPKKMHRHLQKVLKSFLKEYKKSKK